MKLLLYLFLITLMALFSYNEVHAEKDHVPAKREKITAVVLRGSPPLQFHDEKTGSASGFAVDVMDAIAMRAGLEVTYTYANTWSGMIGKVTRGEADIIASLAISEKRRKSLLYSNVIHSSSISIFVRSQNWTIKELGRGLAVGTTKGGIANKSIFNIPDMEVTIYDTFSEGLFSLLAGQIDAFVAAEDIFFKLARDAGVDERIKVTGEPVINIKRGMATGKDDHLLKTMLNREIESFVGSAEYQDIYVKWYGEEDTYWTIKRALFFMTLFIILIVSAMAFWRYRSVLKLNRELVDNIKKRRVVEDNLRISEGRFQDLFSSIRDVIIVADTDRIIMNANQPALRNLFGYELEEVIGKKASILYAEEQGFEEAGKEVYDKDHASAGKVLEVNFKKKVGTNFAGKLNALKLVNKDDKTTGNIGIIQDITKEKKLEDELQRSHKLESIGILAGGIAHDFNNLLTAILNNIYISKVNTDPASRAYEPLTAASKAIVRASDLTRQLLTFSRGGAPVKKATAIGDVIKDSAEFAMRGSNVKCEFCVSDNLWPVEVDAGQISQVIQNLVVNADQSMLEGGRVKILAENVNLGAHPESPVPAGKYVTMSVQDTGKGISKENLQNIFDPYFTTKEMGRGLGLAIAYSIIKNHEGHIFAESEIGVGSIFKIYLPASDMTVASQDPDETSCFTGEGHILIMDDEEMVRSSLGKMLMEMGYTVEYTADGAGALEMYGKALGSANPFDAVILDLTIQGGMGGKEALKQLLAIDPHIRAVVSSGYSHDPVVSDYQKYGFKAVMRKPYNMNHLSRVMHEMISGPNE